MSVKPTPPTLRWSDPPEGPAVVLLDQTRLPSEQVYLRCADVGALVAAIQRLVVRGAPLLGVAGAYGVALAAMRADDVPAAAEVLAEARPTAVNLARGVRRALSAYHGAGGGRSGAKAALGAARSLEREDMAACDAIARLGTGLVSGRGRVLTHCNTGSLVTTGVGTAYGIIREAHRGGHLTTLWIDETRPLLQGARLTAYEAKRDGIPHSVLADNAAASIFAQSEVDVVIVGADRVVADGSVANKVGTYGLAVLAHHHDVPFVVAAPTSTIDLETPDASGITVEQRGGEEIRRIAGTLLTPAESPVYNPAFDVTPADLVSAIVTERGVVRPVDREHLAELVGDERARECIDKSNYVRR